VIVIQILTKRSLDHLDLPPLSQDPCYAVGAFALITI
jgi:hypothetical protein